MTREEKIQLCEDYEQAEREMEIAEKTFMEKRLNLIKLDTRVRFHLGVRGDKWGRDIFGNFPEEFGDMLPDGYENHKR